MSCEIKLDDRLKAIVDLLGKQEIVVDVGCDHGYVANYLVEENISKKVYATDISKDSLKKNKLFSQLRGNEDRVISILGDGLKPLEDVEFDAGILAGMGGELIKKILINSKSLVSNKTLILQPMNSRVELRKYLLENGFIIEKESIVRDKNKFYEIIRAIPGKGSGHKYSFYFGENLIEECDEVLLEYVSFLLEKTKNFLKKANNSNLEKAKVRQEKLKWEINLYEEILDGCKSKRNS